MHQVEITLKLKKLPT